MAPINLMLRYNSDTLKLEYSTNHGSSWSPLDISGMTVVSDITKVDGVALGTHASGYLPDDVRKIEGSALGTHTSGEFPADVRHWNGTAPNNLVSNRVDASVGAVASSVLDGRLFKSIQYGSITLGAGVGSNTYTCSPTVTKANSVLIFLGTSTDENAGSAPGSWFVRITLTSGTTVTATRQRTTNVAIVEFCILEFP